MIASAKTQCSKNGAAWLLHHKGSNSLSFFFNSVLTVQLRQLLTKLILPFLLLFPAYNLFCLASVNLWCLSIVLQYKHQSYTNHCHILVNYVRKYQPRAGGSGLDGELVRFGSKRLIIEL